MWFISPDFASPVSAFHVWYAEARAQESDVPDAMALSTVSPEGRPRVRTVLMKRLDETGIRFYTHTTSRKGEDLAAAPFAAVCFHWKSLERQVIAEGRVEPLPRADVDAYFATRPRESRIGAWASHQSAPLADFADLEAAVAEAEARFAGQDVPCPPGWGGYLLVPDRWQFWQGRKGRLHERLEFVREGEVWRSGLLYP